MALLPTSEGSLTSDRVDYIVAAAYNQREIALWLDGQAGLLASQLIGPEQAAALPRRVRCECCAWLEAKGGSPNDGITARDCAGAYAFCILQS